MSIADSLDACWVVYKLADMAVKAQKRQGFFALEWTEICCMWSWYKINDVRMSPPQKKIIIIKK